MTIDLDNRLELVLTLMLLSECVDDGLIIRGSHPHIDFIRERFRDYIGHRAVAEFKAAWDSEINMDAQPFYALVLTQDYRLDPEVGRQYLSAWLNQGVDIHSLTDGIRDFAAVSNFDDYFENLAKEFHPYLDKLKGIIGRRPVLPLLEDYLGFSFPKTGVLLSSLMKCFMSITIDRANTQEVFCLCSRQGLQIAEENNGLERVLLSSIWHEFSHHVVNPLTDRLFEKPDRMSQQQVEWMCALNESIIWAINTRLLILEGVIADKDSVWMISNGVKCKAPHTGIFHELLLEYERQRCKYPTLADYYCTLVDSVGPTA
jgi:hypothetical protein